MLTFVDNWTPLGRPLHLPLGRLKAAALSNTPKQLRLVDERFVGLTPDLFVSMAAASTVDGSGTRYVQRPLALKAHPRQLCLFKLLSKWLLIVLFIQLVNHVPYYGKAFSQVSDFTPIASC